MVLAHPHNAPPSVHAASAPFASFVAGCNQFPRLAMPRGTKRPRAQSAKKLVTNYKATVVKSRKHARVVTSQFHDLQVSRCHASLPQVACEALF